VNVCKMQGVLAKLPERFTGSLRGEIILTKEAHARHFPDYANTRNAASGIAKRYDGRGSEHLTVLFYQVPDGKEFESESQQFEWLEAMGFKTPNWYVTAMMPGVKTPHDLWLEYQQSKRAELPYDIDGLVVRLQNLEKQLALGETNNRPEGARAFKFQNITRETVLQSIEWQVGGSGVLTPVAYFDPVRLLGAEVSNATLHNIKYITDLGLTPGARIIIARANDVIPKVVSVSFPSPRPFVIPTVCPSCGGRVEMDGAHLVCPDITTCPAQTVGRIKRYVKELGILEWGETLIEKLVEKGLVKRVPDLYRLTKDDLAGIERMGERSAENVLKTLWDKNPIPLENLLGALSIPMCSTTTIRACVDRGLDTWEKFAAASEADFQSVTGVGTVKGGALDNWVRTLGKNAIMPALFEAGVKIKPRLIGAFTGKSFCFTGKSTRKRSELEALVTDNGGTVKASVTKGLHYLVVADPNSGSVKAQAARKNGTAVLSEAEFLSIAGA
jgi:DNA ligase (NAD+)